MSNPTNNDELNNLLNNRESGNLDDFEREALEGFDMLESEEEAHQLKNELDNRIYKKVFFKEEEKKRGGIYWFAAAGLALVIGLSAYFVLNNNDKIIGKDVAVIDNHGEKSAENKDLQNAPVSPPADLKTLNETQLQENAKVSNAEGKVISDAIAEQEEPVKQKIEDLNAGDSVVNTKGPDNRGTARSVPMAPTEATGKTKAQGEVTPGDLSKKSNNNTGAPNKDIVSANDESEKSAIANTVSTEPKTTSYQDGVGAKKAAEKNKEDKVKREEKTELESVVVSTGKEKRKKNSGKKSKAAAYPGTEDSRADDQDRNVAKESNNESIASEKSPGYINNTSTTSQSPASPVKLDSPDNQCYYSGGETDLTKDIREKLKAKNADKKFDAVLYINEKKEVSKINFTNAYDLTSDDKTKVTEVLKSLSKFNFYIAPNTKTLFEYKVQYRP